MALTSGGLFIVRKVRTRLAPSSGSGEAEAGQKTVGKDRRRLMVTAVVRSRGAVFSFRSLDLQRNATGVHESCIIEVRSCQPLVRTSNILASVNKM
jgi:hypothetical protein